MDKLLTLLTLERQAQDCRTPEELFHVIVNESRKLVSYSRMIVWTDGVMGPSLERISGNVVLDPESQYGVELRSAIAAARDRLERAEIIEDKIEETGVTRYLVPLQSPRCGLVGGIMLECAKSLEENEREIVKELARSYTPMMALMQNSSWHGLGGTTIRKLVAKKYIVAAIFVVLFFPTRMSTTVPAEIVPKDAKLMTAPFGGLIGKVMVDPGDQVKEGDLLAEMDSTALKADEEIAYQDWKVTEATFSRVSRESLTSPEKRADLGVLEADIQEKKIRYDYAKSQREKAEIRAAASGIAVFSSRSELEGQPVQTGDMIMKIANPEQSEVLLRIPVRSLIPVKTGDDVTIYFNARPFGGYDASLKTIGYEASPDADGLLTYKMTATLSDNEDTRIGWQGTAKIKGHWTVLLEGLLRRPVLMLRQFTGL